MTPAQHDTRPVAPRAAGRAARQLHGRGGAAHHQFWLGMGRPAGCRRPIPWPWRSRAPGAVDGVGVAVGRCGQVAAGPAGGDRVEQCDLPPVDALGGHAERPRDHAAEARAVQDLRRQRAGEAAAADLEPGEDTSRQAAVTSRPGTISIRAGLTAAAGWRRRTRWPPRRVSSAGNASPALTGE